MKTNFKTFPELLSFVCGITKKKNMVSSVAIAKPLEGAEFLKKEFGEEFGEPFENSIFSGRGICQQLVENDQIDNKVMVFYLVEKKGTEQHKVMSEWFDKSTLKSVVIQPEQESVDNEPQKDKTEA